MTSQMKNALIEMRRVQTTLTDDDRVKLWTVLQVGYCRDCGLSVEPQEICECILAAAE